MPRVAIVGAGISGLATGFELLQRGLPPDELVVLEADDRPGGNIRTERVGDFVIEWGPNGFLDSSPPTLDLVTRLGLAERLLPSRETSAIRFIFRGGRLHEVPTSPVGMFKTGLLSWPGKLRLCCEPLIPRGGSDGESVFDFAARRIGSEPARIMVDSMVSGVFAGDAKRLELKAAFPRMTELEAKYGGLVRALIAIQRERKREGRTSSGPAGPGGRLTSFRGGMDDLVDALVDSLGNSVRTGTKVVGLSWDGTAWSLEVAHARPIVADAIVLACPSRVTAALVRDLAPEASQLLDLIPSASISVVATAYSLESLDAEPWGFGFLTPRGEGPRILGCLWTSSIWENRSPKTHALLRTMVGGAHDPAAIDLSDAELLEVVARDLRTTMGLRAEPEFHRIYRHRQGIPQYEPGHCARLQRIREHLAEHPGLFIAGNSYGGIAVNHCVAEAPRIAQQVFES